MMIKKIHTFLFAFVLISAAYGDEFPLHKNGLTPDHLGMSTSSEVNNFTANEEQVVKAYLAYYGRMPDLGGFNFWVQGLDAQQGDLSAIIDSFGHSLEFDTRFGSFSNEQLIDNLYQQMFGRSADSGGLLFYTSALDTNMRSLQNIAMDIINGAQGEDLMLIETKLLTAQDELSRQEDDLLWHETGLLNKYRPDRQWINQFPTSVTVVASDSISNAIDRCDSLVGIGGYCVVELSSTVRDLPLIISRSNTKLIGAANSLPIESNQNGTFITITDNVDNVVIDSLDLQGHIAGNNEIFAIVIQGESIENIMISNNKVHDFDSDENAHGIAVYGSGNSTENSVTNIIIEGNEIYSMRTGSSESIVINGNVERWEIKNNRVYDINNIAIDAIGGEGISPTQINSTGRILPGELDAARYGFIENNTIENMSTADNPAYGNEETYAAAIYIDGAHHIVIKDNTATNTSWGYEIGAENCVTTHHISLENNKSSLSTFGDLLIGGYAEEGFEENLTINCDSNTSSDKDEGHGYVDTITVKNNHFNSINSGSPITVEFRVTNFLSDLDTF